MFEDAVLTLQQTSFTLSLHSLVLLLPVVRHTSLAGLQRTERTLVEPGPGPDPRPTVNLPVVEDHCPSSVVAVIAVRTDVPAPSVSEENVVCQLLLILVVRTTQPAYHTAPCGQVGSVVSEGTTETTANTLNCNLPDDRLELLLAILLLVNVMLLNDVFNYLLLCLGGDVTILTEECWQLVVFNSLVLLLLFLLPQFSLWPSVSAVLRVVLPHMLLEFPQ